MKTKCIITVIACIVMVAACGPKETSVKQDAAVAETASPTDVVLTKESMAYAGIETGLAEYASVKSVLKVTGMVDVPPQSLVSISFPLGGYLKKTDLLPGQRVSRGQVIALMEDPSYVQLQQDYLQAKARLRMLQADYERQRDLSDVEASSQKSFQQARAEYEMQQVLVKGLSEKLMILGVNPTSLTLDKISRTVAVRSPINGYVKSVHVNIGKYVNPSDVLFEIVDPRDIHAALTVFEKDIQSVKVGQRVEAYTAARPETHYPAEVILVSRDIDESRGATVHCHFEKEHPELLPGMYIAADIQLDGQRLPTVPESAVVRYDGKHYVFTEQADSHFRMTEVTVGEPADGKIPITANYVDWTKQRLVLRNAYALLGKLKNIAEEE